jgi:hypothetical protein
MIGSILLAIAVTAIFVYAEWCAMATRRLRLYEASASRFYAHLKPLLEDGETPARVLELLSFLNRQIIDRRAGYAAIAALRALKRNGGETTSVKSAGNENDEFIAFFNHRPELARAFCQASSEGLLAISYRMPLFGARLRRFVTESNVEQSSEASRYFVAKFETSSQGQACADTGGQPAKC